MSIGDQAETLDLVGSLHIARNRATAYQLGEAMRGLASDLDVIWQLARLHLRAKHYQLRVVDLLAVQTRAQLSQGLLHIRSLCDRVTRTSGWHGVSGAPCRTAIYLNAAPMAA
jgi:hypothetical protein